MELQKNYFSKKNLLIAIAVLILLVIGYLFIPLFHTKHVIVLGNSSVKEVDIPKYTAQTLDKNVFLVKKNKMEEDFLQSPYIKSIQISAKFPRTLVFNITERKAVATIKFSGGFAIIDDNATILETTQDINQIVKPLISGIEPKDVVVGKEVIMGENNNLPLGLSVLSNIKSAKLLSNVSQIDISDMKNLHLITPQGIVVLLGEGKELNEKMLVLNKILINLFERKIYTGYVDMRYDAYPVYRSKK